MNRKALFIFAVYIYHIMFILLTVKLAGDYGDALLVTSLICNVIALVAWTLFDIKENVHWSVYFHFVLGTIIELILNECVLRADGRMTGLDGLAQFFYECELILVTLLLGMIHLIIRLIRRRKML